MKILSEQIFRIFYLCLDFMGGCLTALGRSWLREQLWSRCCSQTFRTHQREQQAPGRTVLGVLCITSTAAGNLCTTTSALGFVVCVRYHCSTPAPQHCCPDVPGSTKTAVHIFPSGKSWVERGWFCVWWSNLSLGMLYLCQSKIAFHAGPIQLAAAKALLKESKVSCLCCPCKSVAKTEVYPIKSQAMQSRAIPIEFPQQ